MELINWRISPPPVLIVQYVRHPLQEEGTAALHDFHQTQNVAVGRSVEVLRVTIGAVRETLESSTIVSRRRSPDRQAHARDVIHAPGSGRWES